MSSGKRILLAKEQGSERDEIEQALTSAGYEVLCVSDGLKALEAMDQFHPDAVLVDLVLPKLDGMQLLRAVRNRKETRGLPVIVVSAVAEPATMIQAIASGARYFLVEPIRPDSLLEKLESVLS